MWNSATPGGTGPVCGPHVTVKLLVLVPVLPAPSVAETTIECGPALMFVEIGLVHGAATEPSNEHIVGEPSLTVHEYVTCGPTDEPSAGDVIVTIGAMPSITIALFAPSEPAVPGLGSVRVALLPTASRITPDSDVASR